MKRITFFDGFDGFPMFSPKGKYLVFTSNRNQLKKVIQTCSSLNGKINEIIF
jgi:Tol biopolymer transport system component